MIRQFMQGLFYNTEAAKAAAEARSEQDNIERYGIFFKGVSTALMLRAASSLDVAGSLGWFALFCASDQLGKLAYKNREQIYNFGERAVNDTISYAKKSFSEIQKRGPSPKK